MESLEKDYSRLNAEPVLEELELLIEDGRSRNMREVCKRLSIFDWWVDTLSVSRMKQMRSFLKLAIELGYTGYVCFKVGVKGCASGMWAHKEPTTNGYSPDGDFIYRSFTTDSTWYQVCKGKEVFPKGSDWKSIKTAPQFKRFVATL